MGSEEQRTIVLQVEAGFREVLKMDIIVEAAVKGCLRLLGLDLVSGPARVCGKNEPRAK